MDRFGVAAALAVGLAGTTVYAVDSALDGCWTDDKNVVHCVTPESRNKAAQDAILNDLKNRQEAARDPRRTERKDLAAFKKAKVYKKCKGLAQDYIAASEAWLAVDPKDTSSEKAARAKREVAVKKYNACDDKEREARSGHHWCEKQYPNDLRLQAACMNTMGY